MECALNSDSEIVKSDGWVRFARLSVSSLSLWSPVACAGLLAGDAVVRFPESQ